MWETLWYLGFETNFRIDWLSIKCTGHSVYHLEQIGAKTVNRGKETAVSRYGSPLKRSPWATNQDPHHEGGCTPSNARQDGIMLVCLAWAVPNVPLQGRQDFRTGLTVIWCSLNAPNSTRFHWVRSMLLVGTLEAEATWSMAVGEFQERAVMIN